MKNYCCTKCGSTDLFIEDRGNQKALMCGDCGKWIKWIGNKELTLVKRFVEENKQDEWRNELEDERVPDKYDFMNLVKDILENVEDDNLDNMGKQLINTVNSIVEYEKKMAKVGLRIRR